eukprot:5580696-Pyramimonas_sp.AAC.1
MLDGYYSCHNILRPTDDGRCFGGGLFSARRGRPPTVRGHGIAWTSGRCRIPYNVQGGHAPRGVFLLRDGGWRSVCEVYS